MDFGHLEGVPQPDPLGDENYHHGYTSPGMILQENCDAASIILVVLVASKS